jgi:glycosyltransferase involved in cell wall biosynthesis
MHAWPVFAITQSILFAFFLYNGLSYLRYRNKEMPFLSSLGWEPIPEGVLVIVPAKDEETGIGPCLERLSALEGLPNMKVIAVNDRSADGTALKMEEMKERFPQKIEVLNITELPSGWLGKNNACWKGFQTGIKHMPEAQYLLFTDGDVKFHPDTLAESITWMKKEKIDYMTLLEDPEFEGILEPAYLLLFGMFIVFFITRPWMLFKPRGKNYMGNGAYLLMRRDAYEKTGGHETLKLEVVEDLRMGLLMRSRGFRCAMAVAKDRMWRRWQPGFVGIFKGLLKNAFAGFEYNIPLTIAGILLFPFVFVGPWITIFTGYPFIGVANLIMIALFFWRGSKNSSGMLWFTGFLLSPFMSLVASANVATSAFKVLRDDGVSWRNTHYPLAELKAQCFTVKKAFNTWWWF